jgi:pyruvate dehydrogenase E2 component (dihydrolipoamide acetyltransferase)
MLRGGLRTVFQPLLQRSYAVRHFASYPTHQVIGLPSLSPTMTVGTIGKWNCKVGDKVGPGDALADVETDKAHVPFESQEEFYIAKLLVPEGSEVKIGEPILIVVEEESSVAAFADFKLAVEPKAAAPAPEAPKAEAKPQPKVEEVPKKQPQSPPPQQQQQQPAAAAPAPKQATPAPQSAAKTASKVSFHWGTGVVNSPLTRKISADQQAYINKYGRTGHQPILSSESK